MKAKFALPVNPGGETEKEGGDGPVNLRKLICDINLPAAGAGAEEAFWMEDDLRGGQKKTEPFRAWIADSFPEGGLAESFGNAGVDGRSTFGTIAGGWEAVEHVSAILAEDVGFVGGLGGHVV